MRSIRNTKPTQAILILIAASVVAIFAAGASRADDLAAANQLIKKNIALMSNIPRLSFKGKSGKVYCKWVREKLALEKAFVAIIIRNPSFEDTGKGRSHDQTIAASKKDIAIAEKDVGLCRAAGL